MNNPEEDARNSLLAHYSAKSTSQASVLVGLAIVFFASVQAYDVLGKLDLPFGLDWAFLVFSIISIIFFGVRAIGKLVIYGELATAILSVEMLSREETRRRLEKNSRRPRSVNYEATYLVRLASAVYDYLEARIKMHAPLHIRILSVTGSKWIGYGYIIALIGLALFVFHLWLQSVLKL